MTMTTRRKKVHRKEIIIACQVLVQIYAAKEFSCHSSVCRKAAVVHLPIALLFFSCSKLRCLIYGCCLADFVLSFDSVHDITSHSFTISPLRISLSLHFAVRCRRFSFYFRYSFSIPVSLWLHYCVHLMIVVVGLFFLQEVSAININFFLFILCRRSVLLSWVMHSASSHQTGHTEDSLCTKDDYLFNFVDFSHLRPGTISI